MRFPESVRMRFPESVRMPSPESVRIRRPRLKPLILNLFSNPELADSRPRKSRFSHQIPIEYSAAPRPQLAQWHGLAFTLAAPRSIAEIGVTPGTLSHFVLRYP